MPTLLELKEDMRSKSLAALTLVDDKDKTPAEKREALEKINPEIKALSEQIKDIEFLDEQRKSLSPFAGAGEGGNGGGGEGRPAGHAKALGSIGEQFVGSDNWKNSVVKGGQFSTGSVEIKATVSESASAVIQPDVQPGVLPILFQRLTVADLMPAGQTTSITVRYLKESTATNAASTVAEGGTKPESTLIYTQVDEPVRKIANVIKVSDEMLNDLPFIRSQIDGRLTLFVRITEEAELLTGNGVAPDLTGLLNRSGLTAAQAVGGDTRIDAIYKDVTKIRVGSFLEPDGIVLHPTDWQTIRLLKDANNQYYGGGPFNYGPYGVGDARDFNTVTRSVPQDTLWGLRVVVTTAMTQGTALVGAFATAAQVFRNGGLTVEATNSNEDDFKTNKVAIRAEERLALAVYRPAAFSTVTGL